MKRRIESCLIVPFICIGRIIAWFKPLHGKYDTFFFFSFYHTGGAEKVHASITKAIGNSDSIIYFTRKSENQHFYKDFEQSNCRIKDISAYTDNKRLYFLNFILRGIISGFINNQKTSIMVFNGQCNFGYKISPWLNQNIAQVELIHSFNTFSWIRVPFIPFISRTIMISKVRIDEHIQQYKKLKVPATYATRISYIINGISLSEFPVIKDYSNTLKVLYVGRGTEEKRVFLIARLAMRAHQLNIPATFEFAGDVLQAIPSELLSYCKLLGNKNGDEIDKIYEAAHIVMITSETEGFPMVIMEGMSKGCVIFATPVGDIPLHVKDHENGFLFSSIKNNETIINEGIKFLTLVAGNRVLLNTMAERNIQYAHDHFGIQEFNKRYTELKAEIRGKV